ncbi:MAG: hypothetical protein JGK01_29310 [Microcoleus sp. PH2017_03_ELD_O_A]|nr:hypothetical protein [Microcoleus sp. PH2017_03_ELD_O_A]
MKVKYIWSYLSRCSRNGGSPAPVWPNWAIAWKSKILVVCGMFAIILKVAAGGSDRVIRGFCEELGIEVPL